MSEIESVFVFMYVFEREKESVCARLKESNRESVFLTEREKGMESLHCRSVVKYLYNIAVTGFESFIEKNA